MSFKDHLPTDAENSKRRQKENNALMQAAFVTDAPALTSSLTDIGVQAQPPSAIQDLLNPLLEDIADFSDNLATTINVQLDKVIAGLQRIQLPDVAAITINFIGLVKNKAEKFFLDLTKENTLNTPTVTFNPPINGITQTEIDANDRNCFLVLARDTEDEVRFDRIGQGATGGGTIPAGTAENQHLEWDNIGAAWQARTNLEFGATGPHADAGFLRFPNNILILAARDVGDSSNIELKIDGNSSVDWTESDNGSIKWQLRAQDAVEPDAAFKLQQNPDDGTSNFLTILDYPGQLDILRDGFLEWFFTATGNFVGSNNDIRGVNALVFDDFGTIGKDIAHFATGLHYDIENATHGHIFRVSGNPPAEVFRIEATAITASQNIVAAGAGEGMTNIGHLDFIDNLATPAAALSLFSDGTDVFANTGGMTVNLSDIHSISAGQTPWLTDIDADGNHLQDLGSAEFRDNAATPAAAIALYSDGVELFTKSNINMNVQDITNLDDIFFSTANMQITHSAGGIQLQVPTGGGITIDFSTSGGGSTFNIGQTFTASNQDFDVNGNALFLDADQDTKWQAGTDDVAQLTIGGVSPTVIISVSQASTVFANTILAAGATEGMENIGHLDFVDNTATPAAPLSIYSDGTDMLVNTGGMVVNLSDLADGIFLDSTFRIQDDGDLTKQLAFQVSGVTTGNTRTMTVPDADGSLFITPAFEVLDMNSFNIIGGGAGNGMTNIGHLDFIDNSATPAATISLYSDGTTLFSKSDLNMNIGSLLNVDILQIVDVGGVVRGSISGDAGNELIISNITGGKTVIQELITPLAEFDATRIDFFENLFMDDNNVTQVKAIKFGGFIDLNMTTESGIQYNNTFDRMDYNVFGTTKTHQFFINGELMMTISRIAANEANIGAEFFTAGEAFAVDKVVDFATFANAAPTDSEMWFEGGLFRFREGGVTKTLTSGSEVFIWSANHDANTFALEDAKFADGTTPSKRVIVDISGASASTNTTLTFLQTLNSVLTFPSISVGTIPYLERTQTWTGINTFTPGASFAGINFGLKADPDPTSGANGDVYYNTTNNKFRGFENGSWIDLITGGEFFGPWTANHLAGNNDLTGLNAIAFTDAGGQIAGSASAPHMNFVLTGDSTFRFTTNAENIVDITDDGLTMLGTNNIIMGNNDITGVNQIAFNETGQTITDDVNGIRIVVPDTTDTIQLSVNSRIVQVADGFVDIADNSLDVTERTAPSATANQAKMYSKDVSTVTHMFVMDSAGVETDLTIAAATSLGALTDVTLSPETTGMILQKSAGDWVDDFITNANLASGVFAAITGLGAQSQNLVMGNNDITGLNALGFTDAGGQIAGSASAPHMNFVLTGDSTFRFTTNAENIVDITDAGLTMLGTNNIIMGNNNITGVNQIAFNVANQTITDDVNGMRFSLPDATDTFQYTINGTVHFALEDFFANWFDTVAQFNTRADPASPAAGDVYVYSKTGLGGVVSLHQKQSDGTITDLAAGGGLSDPIEQKVTNISSGAGAKTIDASLSNIFETTLTASISIGTLSDGLGAGSPYELIHFIVDQNGTGGFDITSWPASVNGVPFINKAANARTDIIMYTEDQGTNWYFTVPAVNPGGGDDQTPILTDIVYGGFDIQNISNVEFQNTTGAPAAGVNAIYKDAGGIILNVATTLDYDLQIAGASEYTFTATALFLKGNDLNVAGGDIVNTGTLTLPTATGTILSTGEAWTMIAGVKAAFNPDTTLSGLNVGQFTSNPSSPANADIFYNSTTELFQFRENGSWVGLIRDKIEEGDSKVEVLDVGAGNINMQVDGTIRLNIIASVANFTVPIDLDDNDITSLKNILSDSSAAPGSWTHTRTGASGDPFEWDFLDGADRLADIQVNRPVSSVGEFAFFVKRAGSTVLEDLLTLDGNSGVRIGNGTSQSSIWDRIGFFGITPVVQQQGVAVSAAGVHAALVNLGLITA